MPVLVRFTLAGPRPLDPANHAKGLRALVLRWFDAASPEMAVALHDAAGTKPYRIGPLVCAGGRGLWTFDVGMVDDHLLPLLASGVASLGPAVRLGRDNYALPSVPQVIKSTSWSELLSQARPATRWMIRLETPTAVRSGSVRRIVCAEPNPQVYARGWLRRWQQYAPVRLSRSVDDVIEDLVLLSANGRSTQTVLDADYRPSGFVGEVLLGVARPHDHDAHGLACMDALVRSAEFGGTGMETMRGMGQTRLVSIPSSQRMDRA